MVSVSQSSIDKEGCESESESESESERQRERERRGGSIQRTTHVWGS